MNQCTFHYLSRASAFLAERVDEDERYSQASEIFEFLIRRNGAMGDAIISAPLVLMRVPILLGGLKSLAFWYWYAIKKEEMIIKVFKIEFQETLPLK